MAQFPVGQVPVAVEDSSQIPKVAHVEAQDSGQCQGVLLLGTVQQSVLELHPAVFERLSWAHLEAGRQSGLDGVLGEDAQRESVKGGDGRAVKLIEGFGMGSRLGELLAQAVLQLGSRLLGERDGCNVFYSHAAVEQGKNSGHQRGGLA